MYNISQIFIQLSARGLKVTEDPNKQLSTRCTLLVSKGSNDSYVEIDKTEFDDNCLNPDWDKKFMIAFKFNELQNLRFDLYHSLNKIGETKIPLSQLVSSKDGFTMKAIKTSNNEKIGKLLISFREIESTKQTIVMQFKGKNLDKMDTFGLSDPYLVISNVDGNGNIKEVFKSEVQKQTINPVWEPIKIKAKTLCQSDYEMKLQFECFDWDSDIKVKIKEDIDFIGSFTTTLEELMSGPSDQTNYQLINTNELVQNLDTYKNSGTICLDNITVETDESFLDYLKNGLQFNMKFAIDFTSLLKFNDFIKTQNNSNSVNNENIFNLFVKTFAEIMTQYNYQNIWMSSGFNAIFGANDSNDNNYELSSNDYQILIKDMDSRLESLKQMTKQLPKKSLTIEPTINQSIEWIENTIKSQTNNTLRYFVLILMTSELNKETLKNIDSTIDKINCKPMSIIIIDFSLNGKEKDVQEISRIMCEKKKLKNRSNIEIISIQKLQQQNNWQTLTTTTVRDIISRIPDQFMSYLSVRNDK